MLNKQTRVLLSIFADGKEHSFFEACCTGVVLLKKPQKYIWNIFRKNLLAPYLVRRCYNSWSPHLDTYCLTPRGDECFREIQISLLKRHRGTEEDIRHFKYFNRDNPRQGRMGVIFEEDNINVRAAGLKEKYPDLFREMYI